MSKKTHLSKAKSVRPEPGLAGPGLAGRLADRSREGAVPF